MPEQSEATKRVFERTVEVLKGKLEPERVEAIRQLVAESGFAQLDKLEEILGKAGAK